MKIKVGDRVFDGAEVPVMVILTSQDKENIANMHPRATKYAEFPDCFDRDEIIRWMGEEA